MLAAPRLRIRRELINRIIREAEEAYPDEVIGVLLGRCIGEEYEVLEAVRLGKARGRFTLDDARWLRAALSGRERGLEYLGVYHSHPDGSARPSGADLHVMLQCPGEVWLIVAIGRDGVKDVRAYTVPGPAAAHRRLELIIEG